MNKKLKILFAVLGGIEVIFHTLTPLLVAILWVNSSGMTDFSSMFFYAIGILATLFRAIKIGFINQNE